MTDGAATELGPALEDLAGVLAGFELRLPRPGAAALEGIRADAVRDIRDHLLPRLADRDAPLVAAFFGATGSGKSVVVNGLAQERVGTPSPVRMSTRRAIVWAHRDHARRYWREFLRQVRERVGPAVETIVGDDPLTRSLTLVDTPAYDLAEDGRVVARDVLAITDLCVFVSSAMRYADAGAWEFLALAQRRGVPTLFVLNRLPADPRQREAIQADYAARLGAAGLLLEPDPALVFAIAEQPTDPVHGGVPPGAVAGLRHELAELADGDLRRRLARQATRGAVLDLARRVAPLGEALTAERAAAAELAGAVERSYQSARADLARRIDEGELAAGDPGRAAAYLVTHLAGTAAQEAAAAWDADPVGRALLERTAGELWRHAPDTHEQAARTYDAWAARAEEATVRDLAGRALSRRKRRVAAGVKIAVLAGTVASAAGLAAAFGSADAAATTVRRAREELVAELGGVLSRDAARFTAALGGPPAPAGDDAITAVVERVTIAAKGLE